MALVDVERETVRAVVYRFLTQKQPTPRRPLLLKVRSPETLDRLVKCALLKPIDNNQSFLPMALAFHHGGEADALGLAKKSVEVVLYVLRNLFETEFDKSDFTPADVELHARKMYDIIEEETIWIGLYLAQEFGAFSQWGGNLSQTEMTSFRISEHILTMRIETAWDDHVRRYDEYLEHHSHPASEKVSKANRWFNEQNRVRLYYLVSECLTQFRPGDIGPRGELEFCALDAILRWRFGRLSLGSGQNVDQIIRNLVLQAPEEELFTLIESVPRAIVNGALGNIDPEWEVDIIESPDHYVEMAIQKLNEFLSELSCPARFLPNGKFDQEGTEDSQPRELLSLPNRNTLKSEIDTLLSGRILLSLIFLDLDGFKQVNEQLGHLEGDTCLQKAVAVFSEVIRSKGRLYRYGGDEFAVLLKNFEIDEAAASAERLRKAIESANIGGSVKVTASIGVAFAGLTLELSSPEALIHAADEAAMVSKHTGKNRVTLWPPKDEARAAAQESRKRKLDVAIESQSRDSAFSKLERDMPELLAEMRSDIAQFPIRREFVTLKKTWSYWGKGDEFIYYYEDHADLDSKLRIMQNLELISDITHNEVSRFVITEELADYLAEKA